MTVFNTVVSFLRDFPGTFMRLLRDYYGTGTLVEQTWDFSGMAMGGWLPAADKPLVLLDLLERDYGV
jgi:hypothetical protein